MATGKPLIFTGILISNNVSNVVGAGNNVTLDLTDDENITITNELQEVLVEGGQTISQFTNQGIEALTYDLDAVNTSVGAIADVVQVNSTIPSKGSIRLIGAAGSVNVDILNTRISAMTTFDQQRQAAMVKATVASTSQITVTDV